MCLHSMSASNLPTMRLLFSETMTKVRLLESKDIGQGYTVNLNLCGVTVTSTASFMMRLILFT